MVPESPPTPARMAGVGAAPRPLFATTASDFAVTDGLLQTFLAAVACGEEAHLHLTFRGGVLDFKTGGVRDLTLPSSLPP